MTREQLRHRLLNAARAFRGGCWISFHGDLSRRAADGSPTTAGRDSAGYPFSRL